MKNYIVTLVYDVDDYLVINVQANNPRMALDCALEDVIDEQKIIQVIIDTEQTNTTVWEG